MPTDVTVGSIVVPLTEARNSLLEARVQLVENTLLGQQRLQKEQENIQKLASISTNGAPLELINTNAGIAQIGGIPYRGYGVRNTLSLEAMIDWLPISEEGVSSDTKFSTYYDSFRTNLQLRIGYNYLLIKNTSGAPLVRNKTITNEGNSDGGVVSATPVTATTDKGFGIAYSNLFGGDTIADGAFGIAFTKGCYLGVSFAGTAGTSVGFNATGDPVTSPTSDITGRIVMATGGAGFSLAAVIQYNWVNNARLLTAPPPVPSVSVTCIVYAGHHFPYEDTLPPFPIPPNIGLSVEAPDACLFDHWHGLGPPISSLEGVGGVGTPAFFEADPDPAGCGFGTKRGFAAVPPAIIPDLGTPDNVSGLLEVTLTFTIAEYLPWKAAAPGAKLGILP